jgi:hypothetical protein
VVEWTRLFRVHDVAFVQEVVVSELCDFLQVGDALVNATLATHLISEKASRYVDLLTPHNDDLLAGENLLRDDGGQATKEVAFTIYDDARRRESGHGGVYEHLSTGPGMTPTSAPT